MFICDWVAVSDVVDIHLARVLQREVSDGIIAPGYEAEALSILSKKKQGGYVILEMDRDYEPPPVQGEMSLTSQLEEKRNEARLDQSALQNVVTQECGVDSGSAARCPDRPHTLKYTQSNSSAWLPMAKPSGSGPVSSHRIHCTRRACAKADLWRLRPTSRHNWITFLSRLLGPNGTTGRPNTFG